MLRILSGKNDDVAGEINEMLEVQRAEASQEKWGLKQVVSPFR